eukprot:2293153-Pleurochrysis_carterae.AAC.5
MPIMPFGCRAFAVKPARVAVSNTKFESRVLVGVHLCRTGNMPGAYNIWVPASKTVVATSDVYFDESLFRGGRWYTPLTHPPNATPSRRWRAQALTTEPSRQAFLPLPRLRLLR